MRVALIFSPFKYKVCEENVRVSQKYFGVFPPLSLAWVAAIAEKAGHEVIIIDARTLKLSKEQVLEVLKQFKPDIMGFMMTTYMFPETLEWIRYLKAKLKTPVIVGGYNLRIYPVESISHAEIDFGVIEHAYYTLPALLKELEGARNFCEVPGLAYKDKNDIKVTPHPEKIDFNLFPNPARHLLPNELYAEFPAQRKNFTLMVTSLGCPHRCSFCEAGGTAYSPRSALTVVNEMEECYRKFNIREIDIFDYDFIVIRERVLAIAKEIQKRKIDVTWACRARIDLIDETLLREMKNAGCRRIYYGIESGIQEILDRVNKGVTLNQIREVIKLTKYFNIQSLGFFLIGAPGETEATVRQTLHFAKELDLDYVKFSKLLAKPGTLMWKDLVKDTGVDYWKEWILGKTKDMPLPRPWTKLNNRQVDRLAKWAYISYHSRPSFLLKSLLKVKSWKELKRKILAYLDMLFFQESTAKINDRFTAYNANPKKLLRKYWHKLKGGE